MSSTGSSAIGSAARPTTGCGIAGWTSTPVAESLHKALLRRGRVDDLDEPGVDVVHQAGHEPARRQSVPCYGGIDSHRRVRVGDRLALQLVLRDLEERGELLRIAREAGYAAVGMLQDHQVPARGLALAKPTQQGPLAQRYRRYPPPDVAHHDTFAELETEYITRVDPGVDATEHLQGVAGREGKAGERPRRGERRVAPNQLVGRDDHVFGAYPSRTAAPRLHLCRLFETCPV